ncbi:MAG: CBU_0585 family protein [Legionellales bacterium]
MSNNDIDKAYVSPYDHFLFEFDATHDKSASQIKEIEKHKRIAHMRDNEDYKETKGAIWEAF